MVTIEMTTRSRTRIKRFAWKTQKGLLNIPNHLAREAGKVMLAKAREIVNTESKYSTHKKEGGLARNIEVKYALQDGRSGVTMVSSLPYASAVEFGTKPHWIRMPIGSKGDNLASHWSPNQQKRPYDGKRAWLHPGSEGMHFMSRALNDVNDRLPDMSSRAIMAEIKAQWNKGNLMGHEI